MKKHAFYTLVRQLREVEQQFTQLEWQLTRLEPEEFARQWEDNTHKLEGGDEEAKERDAAFKRAAKWCLEFHTYRVELERRRRLNSKAAGLNKKGTGAAASPFQHFALPT